MRTSPTAAPASLDRHARVRGCLYGGAVGDALGAPVEFLTVDRIHAEYGPAGLREPQGHPPRISDDTQLTVWTLDGLVRARLHKLSGTEPQRPTLYWVHDAYLRWLLTQNEAPPEGLDPARIRTGWLIDHPAMQGVRGPGMTCLNALRSSERPLRTDRTANRSKGCGTVIRVAPVAFMARSAGHAFEYGAMAGALTHGHPTAWLASATLAHLLCDLLGGVDLLDAVVAARERVDAELDGMEVVAALDAALDLSDRVPDPTPRTLAALGSGRVAEEALAIAVYCALVGRDMRHALTLAVHHDGNSNATAGICGHLVGAWRGTETLPSDWVVRLDLQDLLLPLIDDCMVLADPGFGRDDARWPALLDRYPLA